MLKILTILILFFNFAYSKVVYIPCEASIATANNELITKIKTTTAEINSKTQTLRSKYGEYNSKLKEHNERLESYRLLQKEKNKLLIDIKNELNLIKSELYLGEDDEKIK